VKNIILELAKSQLTVFLNLDDLNEMMQANSPEHRQKIYKMKMQRSLVRTFSIPDDAEWAELGYRSMRDQNQLLQKQPYKRKLTIDETSEELTDMYKVASLNGKMMSKDIKGSQKNLLVSFNSKIFKITQICAYKSDITSGDASPVSHKTFFKDSMANEKRVKLLSIWRYLNCLIDFSTFTTSSLRDNRIYDLFNQWLVSTNQIVFELTKFGTNYTNTSLAKYERVGFNVINDMMMDKLYQMFYILFISDNMQHINDNDLNKRLLVIKARLLEVFIVLCIKVRGFPLETTMMIIRELNKVPNILLHIIDDNNTFEPSLFTMMYRNYLKSICLIPSNLYTNKNKFISIYFPCFLYSLMGERLVSKSGLYASQFLQCLQVIKESQLLQRNKAGSIATALFVVYSEYKQINKQINAKPEADKIKMLLNFLSPSVARNPNESKEQSFKARARREIEIPTSPYPRVKPNQTKAEEIGMASPGAYSDERKSSVSSIPMFADSSKKHINDKKIKDDASISEDSLSNKPNMMLNDEFLKECGFDSAIKNIEEIIQFGNEVLAGKNAEIHRFQGIHLLPTYIILKMDQLLFEDLEAEDQKTNQDFSELLFKGFISSLKGNEDFIRQSFKTGEFLVYCFLMLVRCQWYTPEFFMLMYIQII
jgi:hypothetical protein